MAFSRIAWEEEHVLTLEEFELFGAATAGRVELVRGRVRREPLPGADHGWVGVNLAAQLCRFVRLHELGSVFGDAGFLLFRQPPTVRRPDLAFVSDRRWLDSARDTARDLAVHESSSPTRGPAFALGSDRRRGVLPVVPDLAIEIAGSGDCVSELNEKSIDYLDAGVRLLWCLDPRTRSVVEYRSAAEIRMLRDTDVLEGGDVLPGFRTHAAALFPR